jgi:hypothetical protein
LTLAGTVVLAGSWLGFGLQEEFAVRVLNGPFYWIGFLTREGALAWMAVESLRYWRLLRRRLALGLSDALVTNRFALWGLWAVIVFWMGASDPLARVWYCWVTDTTTIWHPIVGRPIIVAVMAATSALGVGAATSLFLTFFPTASYRRWILSRDPTVAAFVR